MGDIKDIACTYPILVTAKWCPYTLTAKNFWEKAATTAGAGITVVDAESDEGRNIILAKKVAGVPCLIKAPGSMVYGLQLSWEEALSNLRELVLN
jgi:hypothetical protein